MDVPEFPADPVGVSNSGDVAPSLPVGAWEERKEVEKIPPLVFPSVAEP